MFVLDDPQHHSTTAPYGVAVRVSPRVGRDETETEAGGMMHPRLRPSSMENRRIRHIGRSFDLGL